MGNQLDLLLDGRGVRGTSDILARLIQRLHQLRLHGVRHRGKQKRLVLDGFAHGLAGRGGDCQVEVVVSVCHLLRDGHRSALLTIGVLDVPLHVHARFLEGFLEAFRRGVEGGVLNQLVDTDGIGVPTAGITAGVVRG